MLSTKIIETNRVRNFFVQKLYQTNFLKLLTRCEKKNVLKGNTVFTAVYQSDFIQRKYLKIGGKRYMKLFYLANVAGDSDSKSNSHGVRIAFFCGNKQSSFYWLSSQRVRWGKVFQTFTAHKRPTEMGCSNNFSLLSGSLNLQDETFEN